MKKFTNFLAVFAIVFQLSACTTPSDPVKIAEKFATAYLSADYDKCNKMMEDEEFTPSGKMSEMEKAFVKGIKEEAKKMQYLLTVDEEFSDPQSDYPGIYFDVTSKSDPDFDKTIRVDLEKKDNGKWIVSGYKAF